MLATALVGMGITSLSMALAAVRPVGAQLAAVTMDTCEQAAEAALGRRRPDGRPRRGARGAQRGGQRDGVTVTGTPDSTALPLASSTAGSVRSFIDAPGSSTA